MLMKTRAEADLVAALINGDPASAEAAIEAGANANTIFRIRPEIKAVVPINPVTLDFLARHYDPESYKDWEGLNGFTATKLYSDQADAAIAIMDKLGACGTSTITRSIRWSGYCERFSSTAPSLAILRYVEHYLNRRAKLNEVLPIPELVNIVLNYEEDEKKSSRPHQRLFEKLAKDKRREVEQQKFKIKVINVINIIPATTNAIVGFTRTLMEPTMNNAAQTLLSASHLYSILSGVNSYAGIALAINLRIHVISGEYLELFKDLLTTIGCIALPRFIIYMGQPLYPGNPYIVPIYGITMVLGVAYNAYYNVLSLYNEWNTNEFKLKSAIAWRNLAHKIAECKLPIVSDFAHDIEKYNIQKLSEVIVSIAESNFKAQLILKETRSLEINHVHIPLNNQVRHCLELDIGQQFTYFCYDSIAQEFHQFTTGNITCKFIEY